MERIRGRPKVYHRAEILHGKCKNAPSIVEAVQFHGVRNTKGDALLKEVAFLYKSEDLDQLVTNSHLAAKHLQEVGLVDVASALIDTAPTADGYVVNFVVKEPKSFSLGAKLGMSSQGDADMSINTAKQSFAGRGEVVDAAYTYTVKGDHSFNISASKPFLGWQRYENVGASASRSFAFLPWNKSNLEENAFILSYNRQYAKKLHFSAKLNTIWRTMLAAQDTAFAVREHAGHTLKVSTEHSVAFDSRDRTILPTKGIFARVRQELAGAFGLGDAAFHSHEVDFQAAAPVVSRLILAASLRAKVIQTIGSNDLHLLDRTYLGGQHDLRGFALNTVGGAESGGCSLGGGVSVASALHLFHPIPPTNSLYAHAFVASGMSSEEVEENRAWEDVKLAAPPFQSRPSSGLMATIPHLIGALAEERYQKKEKRTRLTFYYEHYKHEPGERAKFAIRKPQNYNHSYHKMTLSRIRSKLGI